MTTKKYKRICSEVALIIFMLSIVAIVIKNPIDVKGKQKTLLKEYSIQLDKFGIKNDGTSPIETSKGINEALKFAKENQYEKIIFPKGIYLISENEPIIINVKNMIIDLNGSTFKINTNGLEKYCIVKFINGAENISFINGIIQGDKNTHDYTTVKGTHEWTTGIIFESGNNIKMENITVCDLPGYGISSASGNENASKRYNVVYTTNLELGDISDIGIFIDGVNTIRTKNAYNISNIDGEFELGYTLGYQGYPVLKNRKYTAYFYDENMNFLEKKECIQYRKVSVPKGSVYVNFRFLQNNIPNNTQNWAAWISDFEPPTNILINNCIIKDNRTLGLAFCGGQKWTIGNNLFENNGGNKPGFAIDFEDGWDLMQDIQVKNNMFKNNKGDVIVCAGDNILFEGNKFTNSFAIQGRTTNYNVINNVFNNSRVNFDYSSDINVKNNKYINSHLLMNSKINNIKKQFVSNEQFINSHISLQEDKQEVINSSIFSDNKNRVYLIGSFRECQIKVYDDIVGPVKIYNSKIEDSFLFLKADSYVENSNIINSKLASTGGSKNIKINKSKIQDTNISVSTWADAFNLTIENSNVLMENNNTSFIEISAGKMKNLILQNNIINNKISKPTLNLADTTYSLPDSNVLLENNTINQINYKYVFDGRDITSGVFNFKQKTNYLNGIEILNPKYIKNQYFNIIN